MVNSSNQMNEINNLIKNERYTDASTLFLSVIESLKKDHSPLLPEYSFNYAHFLFEMQEYEFSLIMYQSAYNLNYRKEEIETFLYNSFILPNNDEFKETYNNHLILYNANIICSYIPSFDELPIDFIPFDEDKYFMFNNKSKMFEGIIDISNDSLNNFEKINFDDELSDIVITDCWDIGIPKSYILSLKDRILYHISLDIKMSLSFLKIPKIMERYCSNLRFIDSLDSFQSYFHNNNSIYLPRLYYGKSLSGNDSKINKILEEEHHYRLTSEGRITSNVLLTIGIPSYNRGHRLLQSIRSLMQLQYDAEIEFVISNNGSVEYTEEYDEISKLKDSRIHYFRFPNNMGANTNFCQVLKISHGKYTCLLSDEDSIHLPSITHYLSVLKNNSNISLVSSCGLGYYRRNACQTFNMGSEDFLRSFLTTNY
ncbi:MAG: glycosyltransferase, partial [Mobilitalea sp.]